ncbi:hypothetical protein ACJ3XI_00065 [Litorimonas sp. RW-G-Af-16]|uniref:CBU_0592 family membrane protein n=1 Tax=Litorimonas sp. RW-G-Af-16 TaxID=3241168 RepID=UPI00390C7A62
MTFAPTPSDILGLIGVSIILATYLALQLGKVAPTDWRYSAANGFGALLILVSLYFTFNLASFVIEIAWLAISLFGLFRAFKSRKSG